jgi:hypothetical protein
MGYFAVSTQDQSDRYLLKNIIEIATSAGYLFSHIEVFDKFKLGVTEFCRFNINKDVEPLLDALLVSGRGVIGQHQSGFLVRMPNKTAKIPISIMQAAPRTRTIYRGNKDPYWARQFE